MVARLCFLFSASLSLPLSLAKFRKATKSDDDNQKSTIARKWKTNESSSYTNTVYDTLYKNLFTNCSASQPIHTHFSVCILFARLSVFFFVIIKVVAILFDFSGVQYGYKLHKLLRSQVKWIAFRDGYSRGTDFRMLSPPPPSPHRRWWQQLWLE